MEPFAVDRLPMCGQWCVVVEPEPELELELGFAVAADVLAASAWLTPNAPAVTVPPASVSATSQRRMPRNAIRSPPPI